MQDFSSSSWEYRPPGPSTGHPYPRPIFSSLLLLHTLPHIIFPYNILPSQTWCSQRCIFSCTWDFLPALSIRVDIDYSPLQYFSPLSFPVYSVCERASPLHNFYLTSIHQFVCLLQVQKSHAVFSFAKLYAFNHHFCPYLGSISNCIAYQCIIVFSNPLTAIAIPGFEHGLGDIHFPIEFSPLFRFQFHLNCFVLGFGCLSTLWFGYNLTVFRFVHVYIQSRNCSDAFSSRHNNIVWAGK